MDKRSDVLIIIPAYNEAENLLQVVEDIRQQCPQCDYLVVNDTVMNAAQEIQSILQAEQCRVQKRLPLAQGITGQD